MAKKEKATKAEEYKKEKVKEKEDVHTEETHSKGMSETTRGIIIGAVVTALIAMVVILLILARNDGENTNVNPSSSNSSPVSYTKEESEMMTTFYKAWKSDKPTLVVYASSSCRYCALQKPIIDELASEYGFDYVYLVAEQLTGTNGTELETVLNLLGIEGRTPDSVIVQNEKVVTHHLGAMEADDYIDFLVSAGILEEGSNFKAEENLTAIDYAGFKNLLNEKGMQVVYFDSYMDCGGSCLSEQITLNDIAKEHNLRIYHLTANVFSTEDRTAFINGLGDLGYSTESYESQKAVSIPLLMFIENGHIIYHQNGSLDAKQIEAKFEELGLFK